MQYLGSETSTQEIGVNLEAGPSLENRETFELHLSLIHPRCDPFVDGVIHSARDRKKLRGPYGKDGRHLPVAGHDPQRSAGKFGRGHHV